jgi:DNA-binding winged helix-turn-helix (wHTH) protein
MLSTRKHSYEFGAFQLIPAERRLLHNDIPVPIGQKSFDLLVVLIENSSHVVSIETVITRLWPGQFIEDSVVFSNIAELRTALGDGVNGQTYIEIMGRHGARFVAPVKEVRSERTAAATVEQRIPDEVAEDKPLSPVWILAAVLVVAALNLFLYGLCSKRSGPPPPRPARTAGRKHVHLLSDAVLPVQYDIDRYR